MSTPLSAEDVFQKSVRLDSVVVDGDTLYWNESVDGKGVVRNESLAACTPLSANVKTRVHEYGGGAFTVTDGRIVYSNDGEIFLDQKKIANGRLGDFVMHKDRIFCVSEESLITIDKSQRTLHSGYDFYSSPAVHPNGQNIAFLAWNHPNMPWDENDLLVYDFMSSETTVVATGASHFQPSYSDDGELYYVSDASGFWNLYNESGNICPMEAEFGQAQWVLGMSRYAHIPDGIASIYTVKGIDFLAINFEPLDLPFTAYRNLVASKSHLYFIAGSPSKPETLYSYEIASHTLIPVRKSLEIKIEEIILPEAIECDECFGNYYAPKEKNPPLIVRPHSGPTTHAKQLFDPRVQFFTSRGFGVLDVNYGGSTGYGRAYRKRLDGKWGVVDVDDCCILTQYLVEQKRVDPKKLIIRGSSAGGFTAMAALAFRDIFACGISCYGISDLAAIAQQTHKFEAHYFDTLIDKSHYSERSPLYHTDAITAPILFLHGDQDAVVPPSQSEKMHKQLPNSEYILFEGEGHGFRKKDTLVSALVAELNFIQKVIK